MHSLAHFKRVIIEKIRFSPGVHKMSISYKVITNQGSHVDLSFAGAERNDLWSLGAFNDLPKYSWTKKEVVSY